jgi:hypothetical protein
METTRSFGATSAITFGHHIKHGILKCGIAGAGGSDTVRMFFFPATAARMISA